MSALDERRAQFQKYKEDVKTRGKPFYPYAKNPDTCGEKDSCLLAPLYSEPADPGTTNFVPRPVWYFYFLFYLLRIFKWPASVILGTVGIPTILLILAFALPFLDVRRERRLLRRPVAVVAAILVVISMGVMTYKGAVAKEALASEVDASVPSWIKKEKLPPDAQPGARLFA